MKHICVSKLTIIGSDNDVSPVRRQAIIETNAGILLNRTWGTNFSEGLGKIHMYSLKWINLKCPLRSCGNYVSAEIYWYEPMCLYMENQLTKRPKKDWKKNFMCIIYPTAQGMNFSYEATFRSCHIWTNPDVETSLYSVRYGRRKTTVTQTCVCRKKIMTSRADYGSCQPL